MFYPKNLLKIIYLCLIIIINYDYLQYILYLKTNQIRMHTQILFYFYYHNNSLINDIY